MAFLGLGIFGTNGDRSSRPYTFDHLQSLHTRLQAITNTDGEQNRDATVEVIRQITEAVIWGEQNGRDNNFFDFFCEKNILADFVRVLGLPRVPKTVKVQLLQTLSMLIQNIRRETSLYYLFSQNYVNQLISTPYDWSDEDILGHYISFLKSLALRLNAETIKFFFNRQQFPLYIEAVRFFAHPDQMVRTTIRNLTLSVYRVQDVAMQSFVLQRSWDTYFVHLACHLRELWLGLDKARQRADKGRNAEFALQEAIEQQQDLLMYVSDVVTLENPALSEAITERLLRYALFPVVLGSLLAFASPAACDGDACDDNGNVGENGFESPGAETSDSAESPRSPKSPVVEATGSCRLSLGCALFVLHQVFDAFRQARPLLEPFATALLLRRPPRELLRCCLNDPPPPPATYRATNPDVSGPSSTEAYVPGDGGLGSPGIAALIERALQSRAEESAARASCAGTHAAREASRSVRGCLLALLHGSNDACVLLAAGVLSACLSCSPVLPQALLRKSGLLPLHGCEGRCQILPSEDSSARDCGKGEAEVLLHVARALERAAVLRVVVVQALMLFVMELVANPAVSGCAACREATVVAARKALRTAAGHVSSAMHGALGDGFLDVFSEEWDSNNSPLIQIKEACSSVRCLVPPATGYIASAGAAGSPMEWAFPAEHSERQHAAKAVACLLLLRRLCLELSQSSAAVLTTGGPGFAADAPSTVAKDLDGVSPTNEASVANPLLVPEEVADGFAEHGAFELGRQDRIVCAVATQEGRHTRYLVLHPFLLLLVQPDLVSPGRAIVRSLAPVRAVEAQADRSDPRTLRLLVRLPKGTPVPSEASAFDAATASDKGFWVSEECHGNCSLFVLTLNFEDTKRCNCADMHLRKRRLEVRSQVRRRIEAFVDELCA